MAVRFLILGDSHAGALVKAAEADALPFAGGILMKGRDMSGHFCAVRDGKFEIDSETGARRLNDILAGSGLGENLIDVDVPILSTVGFNTNNFATLFKGQGLGCAHFEGSQFVSAACFKAAVLDARCGTIEFYRLLAAAGRRVYACYSPQTHQPAFAELAKAFEHILARELTGFGVTMIDVRRDTTDAQGQLRPEFQSSRLGDRLHANADFGRLVIRQFLEAVEKHARKAAETPSPAETKALTSL